MAIVSTVPQLVDKKGGMEPYYIQCIKDGPFKPKTTEGADNPEAQWTQDERKGSRNANHTQTIDLADIYERFVYEVNLIQKGKNHARNGEWIDITIRKVNLLISMDEDVDCLSASVTEVPSTSALQVLRRLGSIFTLVYAVKVYKAGKRLLYVKIDKEISLGNATSKVGIEVQQLSWSFTKLRGRVIDLSTLFSKRKTRLRGGVLSESSQSNESLISVKCNTCGSTIHSTTDHNEFDHFKRETHQGAYLVPG
uniref:Uncharacterized protein n=1 Tax=Tanacetum cinerariifolium TaxID=118510 RepID=A0A6L2LCC8_TANCI|nr:hypothetical protein [Tanacetum cinerariifolium]